VIDVVVVGAGIVGLATARAILERIPGAEVVVVDKEDRVAAHQSGRNSGVIHAGVYYPPGSGKARLCLDGRAALQRFCAEHGVPVAVPGKLIVATAPDELDRLAGLEARARANGIEVHRVGPDGLRAVEPHAAGIAALRVPSTGVVDFGAVSVALAADVVGRGARLELGRAVTGIEDGRGPLVVRTPSGDVRARAAVVCGGVHADELARSAGARPDGDPDAPLPRILPFKGEYLGVRPERAHLVRTLLYPVPDPALPFLGVHLTRDVHGHVHAGPNAVPALGREAYEPGAIDGRHLAALIRAPSTWRLARRWWRTELAEVRRSLDHERFTAAAQRLVPAIEADDLVPAPAGIRAQAIAADGTLLDDFAFASSPRTVHVLNAPSPAATASLAIGAVIADRLVGAIDGLARTRPPGGPPRRH